MSPSLVLLHPAMPVLLESPERRLAGYLGRDENSKSRLTREIVEGCFKAQEKILTGYGQSENKLAKIPRSTDAQTGCHKLNGRTDALRAARRTNSNVSPKRLNYFSCLQRHVPAKAFKTKPRTHQLYISTMRTKRASVQASLPTRFPGAWEKLNETLGLLPNFVCPTVARMTLVKEHNLLHGRIRQTYAKEPILHTSKQKHTCILASPVFVWDLKNAHA